jgi:signal transduction histidine kinase
MRGNLLNFWRQSPEERPFCSAIVGTILYLILAGVYITLSGTWAARQVETIEELKRLEMYKGWAFVALDVHDSGPGISPEHIQNVFKAGFSTKTGGCGIGLPTVKAFAAAVGGEVRVGKSPLGGALFRISIPKI